MSLDFVETDSGVILDTILTALENGCGEPLYPGDERRIFGEAALAPLFVSLFSAINDGCRQKMLRYARGEVLDALGENQRVIREPAKRAETTLRFSVATAPQTNIIIPKGVRVVGSSLYFETVAATILQAGDTYVDVEGVAVEGGEKYNGIEANGINEIVDTYLIPQVSGVTNLDTTSGGTNEEDDNAYRERIRTSSSTLSTAGPAQAYRYWAIAADPINIADAVVESGTQELEKTLDLYELSGDKFAFLGGNHLEADTLKVYASGSTSEAVLNTDYSISYSNNLLVIAIDAGGALAAESEIDVKIDETQEGVVTITPIRKDGEVPDQELLDKVYEATTDSRVKPITDKVVVKAPNTHSYDIELTYYTTAADESAVIATVEGAGGSIDRYIEWQRSSLKRDINPDQLRKYILAPEWEGAVGAVRVEITSPTYVDLPDTTLAQFSGVKNITHVVKD